MGIDLIDSDLETTISLSQWIESQEAREVQRHLEEKIISFLLSQDPKSYDFQKMAIQLAWIGTHPEAKHFLEREIIELNASSFEQCGLMKEVGKASRKVGNFIADHSIEILAGAAICATGVGIAYVTGYAISASVGGVVVAGAGSILHSEKEPEARMPLPDPKACSKEELVLLKTPFSTSLPKLELPSTANELLVTHEGIWTNGQFFPTHALKNHTEISPVYGNDWKSFVYYSYLSERLQGNIPHDTLGQNALAIGNYKQAIHDFAKAIESNPANPIYYLQAGAAHFGLGQYDASLQDYQQFVSRTQNPLSVSEFTIGFAKGLPIGIYDSGKGALLFFADFIYHPIQASQQVIETITTLVNLVRNDEWGTISEALSPEVYQLVTQWDTLPTDKRGELAGYTVGKLGADILVPGALIKVASKSAKGAQELVTICKNLKIAEDTLILETAAGIGNGAKIAEIVRGGENMLALGEDLGLAAQEMGRLKQAGKLEATVLSSIEKVSKNSFLEESIELHKKARIFLKPYLKKPMLEDQVRGYIHGTGIPTFPRPKGIPENYIVRITDRGAGMEYVHPNNKHLSVRVMPGKPHSPHPHQQTPYVIQMKDGKAIDKCGNFVSHESPEAHIPIQEFIYIE